MAAVSYLNTQSPALAVMATAEFSPDYNASQRSSATIIMIKMTIIFASMLCSMLRYHFSRFRAKDTSDVNYFDSTAYAETRHFF